MEGLAVVLFFVVIGVWYLIKGIRVSFKRRSLKRGCTMQVRAVVCDVYVPSMGNTRRIPYYPVYEYTVNEKVYRITCKVKAYDKDEIVMGSPETYFVDPYSPERCLNAVMENDLKDKTASSGFMGVLFILFPFLAEGALLMFPNTDSTVCLGVVFVLEMVFWVVWGSVLTYKNESCRAHVRETAQSEFRF